MKILSHRQIKQKIKRLAIEIAEHNYGEEGIILAGINNKGMTFAQLLLKELTTITEQLITLTRIRLNPANPLSGEVFIEIPVEEVRDKVIIVVDDVANTGRTIFYAVKPLLETLPRRVEVAVLVDRTHKSFPVKVDYVGLSLATTLLQDIDVQIADEEDFAVMLN
jgi:pyrimidine operon attenuation protein/uracil phosphoribosyltransferase